MPEQNDLIIIDYPYERKKPQLNLIIEKPIQPMKQMTQYTFKQVTNTDPELLEECGEFDITLNEKVSKEVYKVRKAFKTEETVITPNTPHNKDKSNFNYSYSGIYLTNNKNKQAYSKEISISNKSGSSSFWKGNIKPEKNNFSFHQIIHQCNNNKPIQIHEHILDYCKYCEDLYAKCISENTNIPFDNNSKCIYCNNDISNNALSYYKQRKGQIVQKPKSTRNNTKESSNVIDPLCKSKTVTKWKLSMKNKNIPEAVPKSVNNSFTDERKLFTKKYSFLQLHNYSSKLIKKDNKKQRSNDLTSRDYYYSFSRRYSQYKLPMKKHQTSLTISFGDENSQSLFEKKMDNHQK